MLIDIEKNRQQAERVAHIDFGDHAIKVNLIRDVEVTVEQGVTEVEQSKRFGFRRTQAETEAEFTKFCEALLPGFERQAATSLRGYLFQLMEEYLGVFETDAPRLILYNQNRPKFAEVIGRAVAKYKAEIERRRTWARERSLRRYDWQVPEAREYNEAANQVVPEAEAHALQPFVQQKNASRPEHRFEQFLEHHRQYIDWWYKNGDEGKQHYAIAYDAAGGGKQLFYVDFVVRMKGGQVFLFDTKSAGSDPDAPAKHNALLQYMADNAPLHLQGGVVIEDPATGNWLYPPHPIADTTHQTDWKAFHPDLYI